MVPFQSPQKHCQDTYSATASKAIHTPLNKTGTVLIFICSEDNMHFISKFKY